MQREAEARTHSTRAAVCAALEGHGQLSLISTGSQQAAGLLPTPTHSTPQRKAATHPLITPLSDESSGDDEESMGGNDFRSGCTQRNRFRIDMGPTRVRPRSDRVSGSSHQDDDDLGGNFDVSMNHEDDDPGYARIDDEIVQENRNFEKRLQPNDWPSGLLRHNSGSPRGGSDGTSRLGASQSPPRDTYGRKTSIFTSMNRTVAPRSSGRYASTA